MPLSVPAIDLQPSRSGWAILICVCLLSALVGRFCYLTRPLDNDAAIFIYMGKMVADGGRLGHDLIDNKFPTVGLMTSILWRTLGTNWAGYIGLQTALSLATAWMLGNIARRHIGDHARLPTLLFAIVYLNFTRVVFGGFQLETVQVFFTVLAARAVLIATETDALGDSFVAGLCAGCGAMLKPTALGVMFAGFLALCIVRRNYKVVFHAAAATAGIAIPLAVAVIYLQQTQLLREMPALVHQISGYAAGSVWTADDWVKPILIGMFLIFPMGVRATLGRRECDAKPHPSMPIVFFAIVWLVVESIGIAMQGRMYLYHFLPLAAPAALLFGAIPGAANPGRLGLALAPMMLLSVLTAANVFAQTFGTSDQLPAAVYLAKNAKPGDTVWIDSWPRLMLETDLRPGARLPFTFLFANYDNAGLDYSEQMIRDFEKTKPAYIFLPVPLDKRIQYQLDSIEELSQRPVRAQNYTEGWQRIRNYTQEHYQKQGIVGGEMVYRRQSASDNTMDAALDTGNR